MNNGGTVYAAKGGAVYLSKGGQDERRDDQAVGRLASSGFTFQKFNSRGDEVWTNYSGSETRILEGKKSQQIKAEASKKNQQIKAEAKKLKDAKQVQVVVMPVYLMTMAI